MSRIGFIGLGIVGSPMAGNHSALLKVIENLSGSDEL
jgi:3-hydroxyisobutyrate dehydrogenase-like beta-hydroxyacid dehydrogenase